MSKESGEFATDVDSTVAGDISIVESTRRRRAPALEQIRGPGAPRMLVLSLPETVIGRGTQANVTIESALLSRRHFALQRRGEELRCLDLGSANGIFLNGVPAYSAVLHDGDTLQAGDVVFVVHEAAP